MTSANTGLRLIDDLASAAGNFPTALRGYDRASVDKYIRSIEQMMKQSRQQVRGLDERAKALQDELRRAQGQAAEEVDMTNHWARAGDILALAEEQAREVREQANNDAERILEASRREAEMVRQDAVRAAAEVKSHGLAEVEQLRLSSQEDARNQVEKARTLAATTVAAARREADAVQHAAHHETQAFRETASLEMETLRRSVEREVAEIRQQITTEREQAVRELRRVHEGAVAKTSALIAETAQHNEQATERLAEDLAEAARIRADALAEVELVKLAATKEAEERVAAAKLQANEITARTQHEFAWRKEQLRRETDVLGQRKQAVLSQLASLSALAEQTGQPFPDLEELEDVNGERSDTVVLTSAAGSPALPSWNGWQAALADHAAKNGAGEPAAAVVGSKRSARRHRSG